jgi:hypothetical protein
MATSGARRTMPRNSSWLKNLGGKVSNRDTALLIAIEFYFARCGVQTKG